MLSIKDAEEKKMVIAYHRLCSKKEVINLLCNSQVYADWLLRWKADFVVNGKCLKLWHQKFVESVLKYKKGIDIPEYYKEYNIFINGITNWINDNYNTKLGRKKNKRRFVDILIEHRKDCLIKLTQQLSNCTHLSDCELVYILPDKTDKMFTELVIYSLLHNGNIIFKGSYDEMMEYIVKME